MEIVRLEDICELITDGTHQTPTYSKEGYIFLSSKNVTSRKIDWQNIKYISEELHKELIKRVIPKKNDILLAKNGTTGVGAIVDKEIEFDIYVSLALLRPNDKILPRYLFWAVNSPAAKRKFDASLKGIGVKNLHLSAIKKIEINIYNKETQEKIIKVLDKLQKVLEERQKLLENLDLLSKCLFIKMFGDPVVDNNTNKIELEKICKISSSKRIFEKEYVSEGIPFYRTKEIVELAKGNKISTELYISKKRYLEIKEQFEIPQENDILITAVGTIGTIWIVDNNREFYFKDGNILRISASKKFNSIYMKRLLEILIENLRKSLSTGTAYSALTINSLKKMLVKDVDLKMQDSYANKIMKIEKSKFLLLNFLKVQDLSIFKVEL